MKAGGDNHHKRVGAQLDGKFPTRPFQTDTIRNRSVLMERAVHDIHDLKNLEFEGQSLYKVFSERGWRGILEAKGKVYSDIVYDFYEQLRKSNGMGMKLDIYIRQVKVVISPVEIASFLHLPRKHPNSRPSQESQHHDVDGKIIYGALTGTGQRVQHDDVNEVISVKEMLPFFQMLNHIVAANIRPTNQTTDIISMEQGKFLLDIAHGVDIDDLPSHIFKTIKNAAGSTSSMDCLPFGRLITGLSLKAGVKPGSNEKEVEPVDPIHLIMPITQTVPLAFPLPQEGTVGRTATSSDQSTLPTGFDIKLLENIKSGVIAELVPQLQRELNGIDSRLKALEDWVKSSIDQGRYPR